MVHFDVYILLWYACYYFSQKVINFPTVSHTRFALRGPDAAIITRISVLHFARKCTERVTRNLTWSVYSLVTQGATVVSHGVATITRTASVQEYFATKLGNRSLDSGCGGGCDSGRGQTKKKRHRKRQTGTA